MPNNPPLNMLSTFVRLRSNASLEPLPVDDGFWSRLANGELGDFHNEFLVSCYTFAADWPSWEIHPHGDEIGCLLAGAVTLILEEQGTNREILLDEIGSFAIIPRGTWHTARVADPAQMLFITAGEGTQTRACNP